MAALFRMTTYENLQEGISNHFSCAVIENGQIFFNETIQCEFLPDEG
tara:strand:+ start:687 stop:827 length:141 start_codon:yes stop_codon:yes gene_type:complete